MGRKSVGGGGQAGEGNEQGVLTRWILPPVIIKIVIESKGFRYRVSALFSCRFGRV